MFSTLKKKSLYVQATTMWFALILSGVFLYGSRGINLIKMLHPIQLSEITEDNMDGTYVTGDIYFLYGEYMSTNTYENNVDKGTSSVSMIIDPNGKNYIGVEIPKQSISEYEYALEECLDNWDNDEWVLDEPFHVSGIIEKMDREERGYYKDYVGDSYSEPDFMPYVLKMEKVSKTSIIASLIFTLIGIGCALTYVYFIVKALRGGYQKPIREFIAAQGNPEYEKDRLEAAWQQAVAIGDIYVMKDYVIFMDGATSMIVRPWDIVWIYKTVTKHRTNGIPSGKTYAMTMALADGNTYNLSSDKKSADEMLTSLRAQLPGAIVGYSQEIADKYQNDRAWFSQGWDEIRNGKM